jgi:DNA-binding transcriptional LysR family regulator
MICIGRNRYLAGMAVDLKHLRYVIAVAEQGHITRAAERLGMQQPPLSRQIKAIEQDIGVRLFRRKPRGVELTDAGRAFVDGARLIFATLDSTLETTRRTARGEQGRICVGCTNGAALNSLVARIIREFREALPLVSLTLVEDYSNNLIERTRNSQIDVAFIRTSIADPEQMAIDLLQNEPEVVALPRGHALARRKGHGDMALSLKDLAGETFLAFGGPLGTLTMQGNALVAACEDAGFSPRVSPVASNSLPRLNLVAAGLGIAVVPASLQRVGIEGVVYRRLKNATQLTSPLNLVSRRGDASAVVGQFVRLAKRSARKQRSD